MGIVQVVISSIVCEYTMMKPTRQIIAFLALLAVAFTFINISSCEASPIRSENIPVQVSGDDITYVKTPTNWCIRIVQKNNTAKVKIVGILTKNNCCNKQRGTQWGDSMCHGARRRGRK